MIAFVIGMTVLILLALHYASFLVRVNRGLNKLHPSRLEASGERVSVIVAARNEEDTIAACVESILQQAYVKDLIEIIIVDDNSTDRTGEIVSAMQKSTPNLRLIRPDKPAGGNKPRAVTAGIEASSGEIILLTDADCVVPKYWIARTAGHLNDTISFVAGPVVEVGSDGFLQGLSRLEFLGLIGVAGGLISSGLPIFCNGANIAFRRSSFLRIGGYGESGHFSDDETLMQRMHTKSPGSVTFCSDPDAIVITASPPSLSTFWRQRVRWSSKRGVYENKLILLKLVSLYLFFLAVLAATVVSFFEPLVLFVLLPLLAGKFVFEWYTLRQAAGLFRQSFSFLHLFIAELVHVPYIVLAAFRGQIGSLRWKGASVRS